MTNYDTSYEKRLQRTLDAVAMKPVDKIPFSYSGPAYVAREQGLTIATYLSDYVKAADAAVGFLNSHPGIDTIHTPSISAYALTTLWLSTVYVPGKDLPEDELWQLDEKEVITFDDYQKIIDGGYGPWLTDYLKNRVGDPLPKMASFIESSPETARRVAVEAHVPVVNALNVGTPIEGFCGGRTLENFFIDMLEEPELVKKAFDVAFEHIYGNYVAQLDAVKPIGAWVGGWRAAPELLSHDMWMEFVWPYLKKLVEATVERNVLPILHFDSCWDSELETLKELPAQKCLLMLDGATDMRLARNVLGDSMCLMGDVPSSLLAFDSADKVYNYVTELIDDVGPKTGLIVSSGCDTPLNAKPENVNAMIEAAAEYSISL